MGVNAFAGDYQDSLGRRSWRGLEQTLLASQGSASPSVCENWGKTIPCFLPASLAAFTGCLPAAGATRCPEVPRGAPKCRGAKPALRASRTPLPSSSGEVCHLAASQPEPHIFVVPVPPLCLLPASRVCSGAPHMKSSGPWCAGAVGSSPGSSSAG